MKEEKVIRLTGITIENFKNVKYGHIDFQPGVNCQSSILGLYGQNGSGKTALVDAMAILKMVLCGYPVLDKYSDYIHVDSEFATLSYEIEVREADDTHTIYLELELRRRQDVKLLNNNEFSAQKNVLKVDIKREVLSYKHTCGDTVVERKNILIDTNTDQLFLPRSKAKKLFHSSDKSLDSQVEMLLIKKLIRNDSRSLIFSAEFVNRLRELEAKKDCMDEARRKLVEEYYYIISTLVDYGHKDLFIIATEDMGLISLGTLPFSFKVGETDQSPVAKIPIRLSQVNRLPEVLVTWIEKVIHKMNIVLDALVPGLKLSIKRLGKEVNSEGNLVELIQFLSHKNGKEIPFNNESDGIKKIVSILNLLIAVFHSPAVTVVIDELDSGVFEYLLGEMLQIIEQRGMGQLIFTSHNLRALETLQKNSICFTTTNPENRYMRFANIKASNNLRDSYFRDIILNEQREKVYDLTNNSEIIMALRRAGVDING